MRNFRDDMNSKMEYKSFINAFFCTLSLPISFALMFTYCRYKSTSGIAKPILLCTIQHRISKDTPFI
jgi:hypothetical protein